MDGCFSSSAEIFLYPAPSLPLHLVLPTVPSIYTYTAVVLPPPRGNFVGNAFSENLFCCPQPPGRLYYMIYAFVADVIVCVRCHLAMVKVFLLN